MEKYFSSNISNIFGFHTKLPAEIFERENLNINVLLLPIVTNQNEHHTLLQAYAYIDCDDVLYKVFEDIYDLDAKMVNNIEQEIISYLNDQKLFFENIEKLICMIDH